MHVVFTRTYTQRHVTSTLQGFYDRGKELNRKTVKDVLTLAAMGPPGGARNPIDPGLASLFLVYEVQAPTSANLRTIFSSILKQHAQGFIPDIQGVRHMSHIVVRITYLLLSQTPASDRIHRIHMGMSISANIISESMQIPCY